jgi:HTH-type transcriptional regulator, sugar sensing transcriptional regulator
LTSDSLKYVVAHQLQEVYMNHDQQLIDRMKNIGLTEYEARAYYALLKRDYLSATELAEVAQVPRTSIYQTLKTLMQKNFCATVPGKVLQYKAQNPEVGFNRITENWMDALKVQQEEVHHLSNSLLELFQERDSYKHPLDYIEIIRDRTQIRKKVRELGFQAENEILSFSKSPYTIDFTNQKEQKGIDFKPEIKYRYVIEINSEEPDQILDYYAYWQQLGADIRVAPKLPVKLMIFDRKVTILSLEDKNVDEHSMTSMAIEHPDLAVLFYQTFEVYFQKAITLNEFLKNRR